MFFYAKGEAAAPFFDSVTSTFFPVWWWEKLSGS